MADATVIDVVETIPAPVVGAPTLNGDLKFKVGSAPYVWSLHFQRQQQERLEAIIGEAVGCDLNQRVSSGHGAESLVAVAGIDSEVLPHVSQHVIRPSIKTALGV